MRIVAVCAIVIFVAWASEQALDSPAPLETELSPAVYAVEAPVASTVAALTPSGGRIATSFSTTPQPFAVPATVDVPPVRDTAQQVTPTVPPPSPLGLADLPLAPSGLSDCESASFYRAQAGLPVIFDALAYRESRCQSDASNWCCSGLWQIHKLWISRLAGCGVYVRNDLYDPQRNACAAAYVYAAQGIHAWSTA